tara:strand:- start:257 stop:781 length:525 start_codon:yes stop_codon:yes gene_type:complete
MLDTNRSPLPDMTDAYQKVQEKKMAKEPRWQDDDCDGKWYEKTDVDGKISKREKKAKAKAYAKEEVETVNEISPDLALKASKKADVERGKKAASGDKEGAAKKAAQASRLYKAQAKKRLNREETEIIDDLVESGLFSDEEIQAILDLDEGSYAKGGYVKGGVVKGKKAVSKGVK